MFYSYASDCFQLMNPKLVCLFQVLNTHNNMEDTAGIDQFATIDSKKF